MVRKSVTVYTDGSCKGNPGPGGWAAIFDNGEEICGGRSRTTNNGMELTAVIEAVKAQATPSRILVITDSTYVMMGKERWKKFVNNPRCKNRELWVELYAALVNGGHTIRFQKIRGHSGNEKNERCDRLAKEQAVKYSHILAGTNTPTINEALQILMGRE